ncbi:MAG: hypothetical protein VX200_02380 [Pseudomonadota bacterium]|nr:hypothetical protein [Pseudomonadota bacterium]
MPQPRAIDPIHLHVRVPPSGPPRPEPQEDPGYDMAKTSAFKLLFGSALGLAMAALTTVAAAAPAIGPDQDGEVMPVSAPLPQNLQHAASGRYSWWQEDDHELHHDADPEVAGDNLPRKVGG